MNTNEEVRKGRKDPGIQKVLTYVGAKYAGTWTWTLMVACFLSI